MTSTTDSSKLAWFVLLVPVLAIGVLVYFNRTTPEPPSPVISETQPAAPAVSIPAQPQTPVYPVTPAEESPQPNLPVLSASDGELKQAALALITEDQFERYLFEDEMVRRFVTTIDNLDRENLSLDKRTVKAIRGSFFVSEIDENTFLSSDNYLRYDPFINLITQTDTEQWILLYQKYYPLFQQAFEELGYPNEYFNDRLIQIIDHLNAFEYPLSGDAIRLKRPKSMYVYQDDELESLSSGQKLLLRMGPDHALTVQNWLKALRDKLAMAKTNP